MAREIGRSKTTVIYLEKRRNKPNLETATAIQEITMRYGYCIPIMDWFEDHLTVDVTDK
jgi:DNA-binding XRE family transcriptional regulator